MSQPIPMKRIITRQAAQPLDPLHMRNDGIIMVYTHIAMAILYTFIHGVLLISYVWEGRKVRLKMWFESVGIEVSTDRMGLKLPGQDTYLYDWKMEYYVHVNDFKASFQISS